MGNKICKCLFPPKPININEDMYIRILNYRKKEEERIFKEKSEENRKFLYGNLR